MCATGLGRKYTMVIGALVTMIFFFCFTQVRSSAQTLGFNCAISFCLNIYYGTLYAYTPEVLPSAHRGTGNGIAIGLNRIMGILSAVIATVADVSERKNSPLYTIYHKDQHLLIPSQVEQRETVIKPACFPVLCITFLL